MLENLSKESEKLSVILNKGREELRTLVLLEFTKRLIIGTSPTIFLKRIERPIKKTEKEKFKELVKSKIPELIEELPEKSLEKPLVKPLTKEFAPIHPSSVLRVPETRLPPQFAYLKPIPTKEIKLDLGKLNPLLADPAVNIIEVNGAGQQTIVKGKMGTKPTNIILTQEEINRVIQVFSEKSKIPVGEGVTKIALGKYILSAIISREAGSRFIIKKIPLVPQSPIMPRR